MQSNRKTTWKPVKSIKTDVLLVLILLKTQSRGDNSYKVKKAWLSNLGVIRVLRKSFEKHWNYTIKKLVDVNKGGTFAPATTRDVHWNTDKHTNQKQKMYFQKRFKKSLWELKESFKFAPRKTREVHWDIGWESWRKGK